MKHLYRTLIMAILICLTYPVFAQEAFNPDLPNTPSTIDNGDSVYFDLGNAVLAGGYLELPVSVLSDDSIVALDFSLKYNHASIEFDTIFNLTSYIQPLTYYNTSDSTLRFTSFGTQNYQLNTPLIKIRFVRIGGPMLDSDFNSVAAYLNGDACSIKFSSILTLNINENTSENTPMIITDLIRNELSFTSPYACNFLLYDIHGAKLISKEIRPGSSEVFSTEQLKSGIYIAKCIGLNKEYSQKIFITR
jgi:hypothetical protein